MSDSDVDIKESKEKMMKRFKYVPPDGKWTKVKMNNTVDLTGKRLHLFQLPPDFPVENLNGVEIPAPKKKKWSAPIKVTYTKPAAKNSKAPEVQETVEIKCKRLGEQTEAIFHVIDGKLRPYERGMQNLYQGYGVITPVDIEFPEKKDGKHELPAGLRQRFTPTGNRSFSTVAVKPAQCSPDKRQADTSIEFSDAEPPKKSKKSKKRLTKMTDS